jgi:hypothetical protein
MGDPGLHSKFVEMQQEDAFDCGIQRGERDLSREHERLDRARILSQLQSASNLNYRQMLLKALESLNNESALHKSNGERKDGGCDQAVQGVASQ